MPNRILKDQRIILTGASGGIGQALAKAFSKSGCQVIITSRKTDILNQLAGEYPGLKVCPMDVTKPADRQQVIDFAQKEFGSLDLLVNNAGIGSWGHFAESTEEINRKIMEVNFFGPVELTRLAVPLLKKGVHPAVVNVTSMCGRRGVPAWSEYSASKFALVGMSESWRSEFVRFGIDVLTMVPGLTDSGFDKNWLRSDGKANLKEYRGMTPDYLAEQILKAIRNNRSETVFGGEAKKVIWLNRFFPNLVNRIASKRVKKLYEQ